MEKYIKWIRWYSLYKTENIEPGRRWSLKPEPSTIPSRGEVINYFGFGQLVHFGLIKKIAISADTETCMMI